MQTSSAVYIAATRSSRTGNSPQLCGFIARRQARLLQQRLEWEADGWRGWIASLPLTN